MVVKIRFEEKEDKIDVYESQTFFVDKPKNSYELIGRIKFCGMSKQPYFWAFKDNLLSIESMQEIIKKMKEFESLKGKTRGSNGKKM